MRRSAQPAAVLLVALALLVGFTLVSALPANDQTDPSSRSAGKQGSLALYTWFDELGLQVQRISSNFELTGTDVLVSYDPVVRFSSGDVDAVMAHLHGGGDLVLAVTAGSQSVSLAAAAPLLQRLGVQQSGTAAMGNAVPAQPFDPGDLVHRVPFGEGVGFLEAPPLVPLLREGGVVVAALVQVSGGGRAYVLGDTEPLSNDGLRHGDARWFALSLLQRARTGSGRVGFDEYHHGEQSAASVGAGAIFNGPVGVAGALAFAIVLAYLGLSGRRLGRPESLGGGIGVPSATSYVAALAQLYARSRQRGGVAARYAEELKRRVSEMTGVDAHLDDATFVARVGAVDDQRAARLGALLQRARTVAASHPQPAALLRLAREVDGFERAWAEGTA